MNKTLEKVMDEARTTARTLKMTVDVYQTGADCFCIIAHGVQVERGVLVGTVSP